MEKGGMESLNLTLTLTLTFRLVGCYRLRDWCVLNRLRCAVFIGVIFALCRPCYILALYFCAIFALQLSALYVKVCAINGCADRLSHGLARRGCCKDSVVDALTAGSRLMVFTDGAATNSPRIFPRCHLPLHLHLHQRPHLQCFHAGKSAFHISRRYVNQYFFIYCVTGNIAGFFISLK